MKKFIFTVGACFFILALGMSACKSHESVKRDVNKPIAVDGNIIAGENLASNSVLTKIDENLVEKKWKLFEINGVAIAAMKPQPAIEAFIMFHVNENRVNGNSGCNDFAGTYKIEPDNRLIFSGMISTRKMCINNMAIEDQMNKIFSAVDNYTLQDGVLSLKQAQNSLARFVMNE